MFFLSYGILKKINSRDLKIEKQSSVGDISIISTESFFDQDNIIIVQVSDIYYFEEYNVLGIELYDGSYDDFNYSAQLDKKMWKYVDSKYFPIDNSIDSFFESNSIHPNNFTKLKIGSVLIIKKYSFENIFIGKEDEFKQMRNETSLLKDVFKLDDFFIIGHDDFYKSTLNYNEIE
jgi:hypothetical protein